MPIQSHDLHGSAPDKSDTGTNYQVMPGDRILIFVGTKTLCERLHFWRKECHHCSGPQCPCANPTMVNDGSPFLSPVEFAEAPTPAQQ